MKVKPVPYGFGDIRFDTGEVTPFSFYDHALFTSGMFTIYTDLVYRSILPGTHRPTKETL